jgi:hypothetical protein
MPRKHPPAGVNGYKDIRNEIALHFKIDPIEACRSFKNQRLSLLGRIRPQPTLSATPQGPNHDTRENLTDPIRLDLWEEICPDLYRTQEARESLQRLPRLRLEVR